MSNHEVSDKRIGGMLEFYSDPTGQNSHRVRLVLAEKLVSVEVVQMYEGKPKNFSEFNMYNTLPALRDNNLVLWEYKVMMEYLEERFPHPLLLPVDPIVRANIRQYLYYIEREIDPLCTALEKGRTTRRERSAKHLIELVLSMAPHFKDSQFCVSDDYTLADCSLGAFLWRLPYYGITMPQNKHTRSLLEYMRRIFSRPGFLSSLSDDERRMR